MAAILLKLQQVAERTIGLCVKNTTQRRKPKKSNINKSKLAEDVKKAECNTSCIVRVSHDIRRCY